MSKIIDIIFAVFTELLGSDHQRPGPQQVKNQKISQSGLINIYIDNDNGQKG